MSNNLNKLTKSILEKNQYMTIGSSDGEGNAWVSPVTYAYDKKLNFYFVSHTDSKHCRNIEKNKRVSLAIFDSRQLIGDGVGLQIEGIAKKVKIIEVSKAAATYFRRKYPFGKLNQVGAVNAALKQLLNKKLYWFYKITPSKIWLNNPNSNIDERIEINLNKIL